MPTRELDLVLAMRPLVIRIAPKPEMVEAVLNRRLPQVEPLAGDSAEDVLLTLVLEVLGLERRSRCSSSCATTTPCRPRSRMPSPP